MISYRCPDCGSDDEQFHHRRSDAPASVPCRGVRVDSTQQQKQTIEHPVHNPDGSISIELEEVELAPSLSVCGGTAVQRESLPGEQFSRPARGFEALVIYERQNYDSLPDDTKRSLNKYYIPGRNYEPTEPGMKRIEITNMAEYNRHIKTINEYETQKMRDTRSMHREYFGARRKAMRDDVNAKTRHSDLLRSISRVVRARSDRKTDIRYSKALDAHFHAQLIEFNQGKIQDYCDADTGWKSRRAK